MSRDFSVRRGARAVRLADYIRADLGQRIRSGEAIPARLSLIELGRHYGVSVTPLRTAVNGLIEDGLITKLPNRRLEVSGPRRRTRTARKPVPAPPTPSHWDETLLKTIMQASLCRRATYVREQALSRELRIGRSIIRQTFNRFAGAGLIEHVPRRGWLVHPVRREDMDAYLEVRGTLELKALELSRFRLRKVDLREMLESDRSLATGAPPVLDNRMHDYLIDKSGNLYIRQFFQQYIARYYTALFYYAAPETAVVDRMVLQHRRIIEALIARDWKRARRLLSQHIRAQGPVLMKLVEKGSHKS
jgi:DNA-binding GntR family transcriptional regulator